MLRENRGKQNARLIVAGVIILYCPRPLRSENGTAWCDLFWTCESTSPLCFLRWLHPWSWDLFIWRWVCRPPRLCDRRIADSQWREYCSGSCGSARRLGYSGLVCQEKMLMLRFWTPLQSIQMCSFNNWPTITATNNQLAVRTIKQGNSKCFNSTINKNNEIKRV